MSTPLGQPVARGAGSLSTIEISGPMDPLSDAIAPPADEKADDKRFRLRNESEAKMISDEIDERLRQERVAAKRNRTVKLLLLGQSESGKSTTLKQFQLLMNQNAFNSERSLWRLVVFLNVVRSVRKILKAIEGYLDNDAHPSDHNLDADSTLKVGKTERAERIQFFKHISAALAPLLSIEERLKRSMSLEETLYPAISSALSVDGHDMAPAEESEFFVRPNSAWKARLASYTNAPRASSASSSSERGAANDQSDPAEVIASAGADILRLWNHPFAQLVLQELTLRLEDSGGFFLHDLDRIASAQYVPTNEDILHCRIKTLGITEYEFALDLPHQKHALWKIYDVGGSRSQRPSWAPYFDDVNALIFLAPISAFDQTLAEDPRINRLEDSLTMWKEVMANTVLQDVPVILFLNKCDILKAKIDAGVRLNKYVLNYGERPNEFVAIAKYFRDKFNAIKKQYSKSNRPVYIHLTSVTDTTSTTDIVGHIRDMLVKEALKESLHKSQLLR